MSEDIALELKRERETFNEYWHNIMHLYQGGKFDERKTNLKPVLRLQKKMILKLGSEVEVVDNGKHIGEMAKFMELYDLYAPGEAQSRIIPGNLTSALQIQRKINKMCASILKKAEKKEKSFPREDSTEDQVMVD